MDLKSYGKRVNSDKFCQTENLTLWIIWTVCLYSDGAELTGGGCICIIKLYKQEIGV